MKHSKIEFLKHVVGLFLFMFTIRVMANTSPATEPSNEVQWGTEVHHSLFRMAFPFESPTCIKQMQRGSDEVDSVSHQFEAGLSYQHAMRAPTQSVESARLQMKQFIKETYYVARRLLSNGNQAQSCFERGRALHPVQDSTSPAHEGFQVWDPIGNPSQILEHGDQPFSQETLAKLLADPDRLERTISLMRVVDANGISEGMSAL